MTPDQKGSYWVDGILYERIPEGAIQPGYIDIPLFLGPNAHERTIEALKEWADRNGFDVDWTEIEKADG